MTENALSSLVPLQVPDPWFSDMSRSLEDLRGIIDGIDRQILELLNRRAQAGLEIGAIKKLENQPVYAPSREQAILERLSRENAGPLPDDAVQTVFRAIIDQVRALEEDNHD